MEDWAGWRWVMKVEGGGGVVLREEGSRGDDWGEASHQKGEFLSSTQNSPQMRPATVAQRISSSGAGGNVGARGPSSLRGCAGGCLSHRVCG